MLCDFLTANNSNQKLFLELGKVSNIASKEITIEIVEVVGNDTAFKFNSERPGKKLRTLTKTLSLLETARNFRDSLGQELLGLPPGWTSIGSEPAAISGDSPTAAAVEMATAADTRSSTTSSTLPAVPSKSTPTLLPATSTVSVSVDSSVPPVAYHYRLRKTDWQKEVGTDLVLETDNKGALLTLDEAGVSAESLLFFEEGDLPLPGVRSFSLCAWVPSFDGDREGTRVSTYWEQTKQGLEDAAIELADSSNSASGADDSVVYVDKIDLTSSTPSSSSSVSSPVNATIAAIERRQKKCIRYLGEVKVLEEDSLSRLEDVCFNLLASSLSGTHICTVKLELTHFVRCLL